MSLTAAAAIAAGASLAGGIGANRASAKQAQMNRDFQEEMSNTSYQRGVADMKAAGINPMLSSKVGGASSPTGSVAAQSDVATPAVSSAMQYQRMEADLNNVNADTTKKSAEADLAVSEKKLTDARAISESGVPNVQASDIGLKDASASEVLRRAEKYQFEIDKLKEEQRHLRTDSERIEAATTFLREQIESENIDQSTALVIRNLYKAQVNGELRENALKDFALEMSPSQIEALKLALPRLRFMAEHADAAGFIELASQVVTSAGVGVGSALAIRRAGGGPAPSTTIRADKKSPFKSR